MPYKEVVKTLDHAREYVRDFYVYGFKTKDEFSHDSSKTYDDYHRRIKSWLADYMRFERRGKKITFISIDSRAIKHNPLYKCWKTKSFTDKDIILHFLIFDFLYDNETWIARKELIDGLNDTYPEYLKLVPDEKTFRNKFKEYVDLGLLEFKEENKEIYYRRTDDIVPGFDISHSDVLDYFSEIAPCGVIGSFLLDKYDYTWEQEQKGSNFAFKHHYITSAMESDNLCAIFDAIGKRSNIILAINKNGEYLIKQKAVRREKSKSKIVCNVVPLKIMIGVQTGRQYLMAYNTENQKIMPFRVDYVTCEGVTDQKNSEKEWEKYQKQLQDMLPHIWGVTTGDGRLEHVEFTVRYSEEEMYIPKRMEREKRCGQVDYPAPGLCRFQADVYESREMLPWIRTFFSRIVEINFSNKEIEEVFWTDLEEMYHLYGVDEEVKPDV